MVLWKRLLSIVMAAILYCVLFEKRLLMRLWSTDRPLPAKAFVEHCDGSYSSACGPPKALVDAFVVVEHCDSAFR